jgi:hypothetical protein
LDWDFFWRESTRDGIYNNAVALVRSGKTCNAPYIGRHWSFVAIYGHFFAARFLKESGPGEDLDYVTTWITYRF